LVHALDCSDAAQMVADIQQRYERPLLIIFGEITDTTQGEKA
jgi:multisubunit Na+/H+ antiporter MnhE subunit